MRCINMQCHACMYIHRPTSLYHMYFAPFAVLLSTADLSNFVAARKIFLPNLASRCLFIGGIFFSFVEVFGSFRPRAGSAAPCNSVCCGDNA